MICKKYVAAGEDINDAMVMESTVYISYTLRSTKELVSLRSQFGANMWNYTQRVKNSSFSF
jgi:hypothetical protein